MRSPNSRYIDPETVANRLGTSPDEVISLITRGEIRGIQLGDPPRWVVDEASVTAFIDDRIEIARRSALWRQSQEASFPELWGEGDVRHPD